MYIDKVVPAVFDPLPRDQIEILRVAVRYHSDGLVARAASDRGLFDELDGPRDIVVGTIACCWDADRLDIPRVGISPDVTFMSTGSWRDVMPLSLRMHRHR